MWQAPTVTDMTPPTKRLLSNIENSIDMHDFCYSHYDKYTKLYFCAFLLVINAFLSDIFKKYIFDQNPILEQIPTHTIKNDISNV